jgi:hypothetical protein
MVTATPAVYSVQLVSLRCVESLELDGDDIELKFNGQTIWTSGKHKMHPRPANAQQIKQFDFETGKIYTANGWEFVTPFAPGAFVFNSLSKDSRFELWEHDTLTGDENLARSPVSARDAGHGNISIVFAKDGARYVLTYRVTV